MEDPSLDVLPTAGAHSAPAANPTPGSAPNHSLNHPPYAEMITAAIGALKERNGSSKVAIAKYIESTYTNLPPSHSALLTHHLKRLKTNGVLQMVKHSYKLKVPRSGPSKDDSVAAGDPVPGSKRGRGRPPKHRPVISNPRADPNPTFVALGLVDEPAAPLPAVPKRSPGRPPKAKASMAAEAAPGLGSAAGVKRPRGRPRKEGSLLLANAPGGSLAVQALSVKRRGRPPRVGAGRKLRMLTGATLGRPPRVGGAARKPRKLTGRPPGRPRKTLQWANDSDLKLRLEHFQSKVKEAVDVLKAYLTNDSAMSVATAIQDLEQLAVMDLSAPFAAQSQQPAAVQQGPELVEPSSTQEPLP